MPTNLARTQGYMETDVARGSGLGLNVFTSHLVGDQTRNVNARPVGGTASAAVTAWTALTVASGSVPFCGTLVAQVIQSSTTTGTLQLRVRGYDQFGEYVEEITPVVSLAAKTNNFVYLAKVFAYVVSVDFKSTGLDIAGDTISIGQRWDWTRTVDGMNEHVGGRNLGIAIPVRIGKRPAGAVGSRKQWQQLWGGGASPLASAMLTMSGTASNGETVTIDGTVYTFRAAAPTVAYEVLIGLSAAESLANLAAAILGASGAGTLYGSGTVAHATVRVRERSATVLTIEAKSPGAYQNTVAVSEAMTNGSWSWNAAATTTLNGAWDDPVEVQGITVRDITGSGSAGAVTPLHPREYAVGYSETGWSGSSEKVHILKSSSVAQWANSDNVMVTMTVRSLDSRI